ncbi:putative ABC transport system ATP-binding protein [Lachnospiraceae bacterium NE2001]|nr:putative ABC transport system ATP-binding protein [Lachnospiraceae bacterium NE2001]
MKTTILSAKDVQKSFANNGEITTVLTNVNMDVYAGDFTVIMGSSGSGKSTLLYALSGMDKATAGEVIYTRPDSKKDKHGKKEVNITSLKEKKMSDIRVKDFGFVFQQMHLVSNLSLLENVAVTGYLNKERNAADTKKRAEELLERMGLSDVKTHIPSRVSGGEQQRCAIARAVINEPAILFADEPTGALNRRNTKDVLDLLTELNNSGQSIVMVTHDIKAALHGNRILYLDDGNIVGELELSRYGEKDSEGNLLQDKKAREAQVNAWLESLDW